MPCPAPAIFCGQLSRTHAVHRTGEREREREREIERERGERARERDPKGVPHFMQGYLRPSMPLLVVRRPTHRVPYVKDLRINTLAWTADFEYPLNRWFLVCILSGTSDGDMSKV